jgi:uncharacterized protein (TIGR03435 family)
MEGEETPMKRHNDRESPWRRNILLPLLALGSLTLAQAQQGPRFEVASVNFCPPPDSSGQIFFGPPRGGPGTHDPIRITWTNALLLNILPTAYHVTTLQIVGPDWISNERYDIVAKVPEGATREQVALMWQNLLEERFGMLLHHESRDFQVDELTIAKGGLKMKATELPADAEPFTPDSVKPAKNGALELNGSGAVITILPGAGGGPLGRITVKGLSVSDIAARLSQQLRHPVIDKTGLKGKYDFALEYTPDLSGVPPPPDAAAPLVPPTSDLGPNLPSALEKQLGLRLIKAKAKLDVIVVDHAEKTPTEN